MGFPIRRMFVVSVSLFYIYMGVCTVSPILNSSLHSELVSNIILHHDLNTYYYYYFYYYFYLALGFAYSISSISNKHAFQTYFDDFITKIYKSTEKFVLRTCQSIPRKIRSKYRSRTLQICLRCGGNRCRLVVLFKIKLNFAAFFK